MKNGGGKQNIGSKRVVFVELYILVYVREKDKRSMFEREGESTAKEGAVAKEFESQQLPFETLPATILYGP